MPVVICVEGADGSGKSTVTRLIQDECSAKGLSCEVVGRTSESANVYVGEVTDLTKRLHQDSDTFVLEADLHLRLAREYLRAHQCRKSAADVVILDRFVLSVLSRMRIDGEQVELYLPHLRDIASRAGLVATVFCECPFEVAWSRVQRDVETGERATLSPKEARGEKYLRTLLEAMTKDFRELGWVGAKIPILTDAGRERALEQLRAQLLPQLVP